MSTPAADFTCLEICAGAGGQALGLHNAGVCHTLLVEYERDYCACLKANMPQWEVLCEDVRRFDGSPYSGAVDLLAGGVPCPPFSLAGHQLGKDDERDLFPEMLRLAEEIRPKAVMIENVRGLMDSKFDAYRDDITGRLASAGYNVHMKLLNSSDYGVSQLRPRVVIVGIRTDIEDTFCFPAPCGQPEDLGTLLYDLMAENGWEGACDWRDGARGIAPTLVGGSKKHGGPDLGPTRAKRAWAQLGIEGKSIADAAPLPGFQGMPRLTPRMMARVQGFPDSWTFGKRKTTACRMIGNAFPPPVAEAVGSQIIKVLKENGDYN